LLEFYFYFSAGSESAGGAMNWGKSLNLAIKINSGLGGLSELWPGVKVLAAHFFHGLLSGAIFWRF